MSILSVLHDEADLIANALRQQAHRMEAALGHIPEEVEALIEKIEGHAQSTAPVVEPEPVAAPVVEPEVVVETPVAEETHEEQK